MITADEQKTIIDTYKQVLGTDDLKDITALEMLQVLEPEAILEKFAFKKANKIGKQ